MSGVAAAPRSARAWAGDSGANSLRSPAPSNGEEKALGLKREPTSRVMRMAPSQFDRVSRVGGPLGAARTPLCAFRAAALKHVHDTKAQRQRPNARAGAATCGKVYVLQAWRPRGTALPSRRLPLQLRRIDPLDTRRPRCPSNQRSTSSGREAKEECCPKIQHHGGHRCEIGRPNADLRKKRPPPSMTRRGGSRRGAPMPPRPGTSSFFPVAP